MELNFKFFFFIYASSSGVPRCPIQAESKAESHREGYQFITNVCDWSMTCYELEQAYSVVQSTGCKSADVSRNKISIFYLL